MKILISITSLLIFFWSTNVGFLKVNKESIYFHTNTEFEENWNKQFSGLWVNENDQTRATTKCKILYKNNSFIVQMWGACQPNDCDWGESVSNEIKEGTKKFQLLWDHEYAESIITYELINGKLKLTQIRSYKDDSGRQDNTLIEYFVKQ